jgi:hypothetical protein
MIDIEKPVRAESFPHGDTTHVQVRVASGEVAVELTDTDEVSVAVEPGAAAAGGSAVTHADVEEAVRQVVVRFVRGRLVVDGPRRRTAHVPLRIVVRARPGSALTFTGAGANVTVTGRAGLLTAKWATGDLTADDVTGPCVVRAGSGRLALGAVSGPLSVKIGKADVHVRRIAGAARITTGGGTLSVGTVEGDVSLTTDAREVSVADAAAGHVHVRTGSGATRIGVRPGVRARVELFSRLGVASSDLPVSARPPAAGGATREDTPLSISAVSATGDILVTSAA